MSCVYKARVKARLPRYYGAFLALRVLLSSVPVREPRVAKKPGQLPERPLSRPSFVFVPLEPREGQNKRSSKTAVWAVKTLQCCLESIFNLMC